MSRDSGEPAFPVPGFEYEDDRKPDNVERVVYLPAKGMTLRDYFAAKAMQGMLSAPYNAASDQYMTARDAYAVADAMLKERAK